MNTRLLTLCGPELTPWLDHIAALRIQVFRDFPYLYDGSLAYEADYLRIYTQCDSAICVLALSDDEVVGASTGLALSDETEAFQRPFDETGCDIGTIFYCAESVLLPQYRGTGLYSGFFQARESHARRLGKQVSVFCAVQRPVDHPLRPADYQSLDPVWQHFGYTPSFELVTGFRWKDIDQAEETEKPMLFYIKSLT